MASPEGLVAATRDFVSDYPVMEIASIFIVVTGMIASMHFGANAGREAYQKHIAINESGWHSQQSF
jgi:hypothetical protein